MWRSQPLVFEEKLSGAGSESKVIFLPTARFLYTSPLSCQKILQEILGGSLIIFIYIRNAKLCRTVTIPAENGIFFTQDLQERTWSCAEFSSLLWRTADKKMGVGETGVLFLCEAMPFHRSLWKTWEGFSAQQDPKNGQTWHFVRTHYMPAFQVKCFSMYIYPINRTNTYPINIRYPVSAGLQSKIMKQK